MPFFLFLDSLSGCEHEEKPPCVATSWYADLDGDAVGGPAVVLSCSAPSGAVAAGGDCDDGDPLVHPGADETCDGYDDDCDGVVDEEPVDGLDLWEDVDGDGYGTGDSFRRCAADGWVEVDGDCEDDDAARSPGAIETCDGVDQDCDDVIDGSAVDAHVYYADSDGDGFGDPAFPTEACAPPPGYADDNTDCDDTDSHVWPGAPTSCTGDSDCDGATGNDEPGALDAAPWFADADGDGFGNDNVVWVGCTAPAGWVAGAGDCDDARATINPAAPEICAAGDEDCDGLSDGADDSVSDAPTWYADADGDGFGDPTVGETACIGPTGKVADGTDCDDTDAAIRPDAAELCAAGDEDCDGLTEDADPDVADPQTWYADADGDAYGDASVVTIACTASGSVSNSRDCDDADASSYPLALDTCEDGIDEDCSGGDQSCSPTGVWGIASADARLRTRNGRGGYRVAGGDIDGDGYGDVFTGALEYDTVGPMAGAVGVFFGPVSGESYAETDGVMLLAESENDHVGTGVVFTGDLDGDGNGELLIGAYYADPDFAGRAYLVTSSSLASAAPGDQISLADADTIFIGSASYDYLGDSTAALGDVDGDGLADLGLGAYGNSTNGYHAGAAYVFSGAASWGEVDPDSAAMAIFLGEGSGSHSSGSMDSAGDYDGDGLDDVLVSAEAEDHNGILSGSAYVFLAPFSGTVEMTTADLILDGEQTADLAGSWVSGAGDTNGDGHPDLLIGARANGRGGFEAGAGFLVLGPVLGQRTLDTADAVIEGPEESAFAGHGLDGVGDLDGDGYDDVAVGAWKDSTVGYHYGSVAVAYGPVSGSVPFASADWWVQSGGGAGIAVGSSDTDGDGHPDLLIGGFDANSVWVLLGRSR